MIPKSNLLRLFEGNMGMVNSFIASFKRDVPKNLDLLNEQLLQKKWADASILSHNIKTQCFYIGLEEIGDIALQIEKMTEHEKVDDSCFILYDKLKREILDLIS